MNTKHTCNPPCLACKDEGRLDTIREMMNKNPKPYWVKILPEKFEIDAQMLFSFLHEYGKIVETPSAEQFSCPYCLKVFDVEEDRNIHSGICRL